MPFRGDYLNAERDCRRMADGASPDAKRILETMADGYRAAATDLPEGPKSRRVWTVLFSVMGIFAIYFLTAYWLKQNDPVVISPVVSGHIVHLQQPFIIRGNFGAVSPDYWFGDVADSDSDLHRSPVAIYENDRPLGPAHTDRAEVAEKGMGRISHWRSDDSPVLYGGRSMFVFSSSDNSDPNRNGRAYWVVLP